MTLDSTDNPATFPPVGVRHELEPQTITVVDELHRHDGKRERSRHVVEVGPCYFDDAGVLVHRYAPTTLGEAASSCACGGSRGR